MHSEDVTHKLSDFAQREEKHRRWSYARRPKAIGDVLAQVLTKKNYAAVQTNQQLTETWTAAAGPRLAPFTEVVRINRGRLEVTVSSSTMMQELTFEKARILAAVRDAMPETKITDLRLRVGKIHSSPSN